MAAILENPDDDLPRRIAADYLDGELHCAESSRQPERAEFIRVQCEIASPSQFVQGPHSFPGANTGEEFFTSYCSHGCGCWMGSTRSGGPVDPFGPCPDNRIPNPKRMDALRRRERELLSANEGTFLGGPNAILFECVHFGNRKYSPMFRRGFVSSIRCTADDWQRIHIPTIIDEYTDGTTARLSTETTIGQLILSAAPISKIQFTNPGDKREIRILKLFPNGWVLQHLADVADISTTSLVQLKEKSYLNRQDLVSRMPQQLRSWGIEINWWGHSRINWGAADQGLPAQIVERIDNRLDMRLVINGNCIGRIREYHVTPESESIQGNIRVVLFNGNQYYLRNGRVSNQDYRNFGLRREPEETYNYNPSEFQVIYPSSTAPMFSMTPITP